MTDNAANMKKALSLIFEVEEETENTINNYFDDSSLWDDAPVEELESTETFSVAKRIPCFAHSLQLVVRDGLNNTKLAKTSMARCTKLSNMVHQSALFRGAFERVFAKSIPTANETRWNSTFHQLNAIIDLDQQKLTDILRETTQENLIMSAKKVLVTTVYSVDI